MEEAGEIPPILRIKRYTPPDDTHTRAIGYILEFLRFHELSHTAECLTREANAGLEVPANLHADLSLIAQAIRLKTPDEEEF
jgi:hypothetical protein